MLSRLAAASRENAAHEAVSQQTNGQHESSYVVHHITPLDDEEVSARECLCRHCLCRFAAPSGVSGVPAPRSASPCPTFPRASRSSRLGGSLTGALPGVSGAFRTRVLLAAYPLLL
jgi:hypothetical protein